jgi:hypothetical protein
MSRFFNGTTDNMTMSLGGAGFQMGDGTVVAVLKRFASAAGANHFIFCAGLSNVGWTFRFENDLLSMQIDGTARPGITTWSDTSKTLICAASKATGTTKVRYHGKYLDAGSAWVHEDTAGTAQANSSTPATSCRVGCNPAGSAFGNFDLFCVGLFNAVLTDDQIESLANGLNFWQLPSLKDLIMWDTAAVAQRPYDPVGGMTQTAISGTSVSTQPVIFSYGGPLLYCPRNYGTAGVTLTPTELVHSRALNTGTVVSPKTGPSSIVHSRVLGSPSVAESLKIAASLVHSRALSTGALVSPKLFTASLAHSRAIGGVKLTESFYPASLVHGRALNTPVKVNDALKLTSITHTRALGAPAVTSAGQLTIAVSQVHTRAIGGVKLNPTLKPGSLVHARALGSLTITWAPTPGSILQWSYGAFRTGMFTRQVVHR